MIAVAVASAPAGWWVSDQFESQNSFCVACHLDGETPLHETKHAEFRGETSPEPVSLAAVHGGEADFRCIDCHGGASFAIRVPRSRPEVPG